MTLFESKQRSVAARRGAALIALIALLSIVTLLAAVWTRKVVTEHRHRRHVEELVQVRWLLDAGLQRAAARLIADPQFTEETWQITPADLDRAHDAAVSLTAESTDIPGQYQLTVEARYPAANPRIKRSKTVTFSPPVLEPAP